MVYSLASSYPYNSLEQQGNPEKQQFLPKILAIPLLSLNPNTTSPQKNLANLLYRALLTSNRKTSSGTTVVDVEADQGGGHGRPYVLRYAIDFGSAMLCIKIGYRVYNVLR